MIAVIELTGPELLALLRAGLGTEFSGNLVVRMLGLAPRAERPEELAVGRELLMAHFGKSTQLPVELRAWLAAALTSQDVWIVQQSGGEVRRRMLFVAPTALAVLDVMPKGFRLEVLPEKKHTQKLRSELIDIGPHDTVTVVSGALDSGLAWHEGQLYQLASGEWEGPWPEAEVNVADRFADFLDDVVGV